MQTVKHFGSTIRVTNGAADRHGHGDPYDLRTRICRHLCRWMLLFFCLYGIGGVTPGIAEVTNWYEEGLKALGTGDYERAIKNFSIGLEIFPQDYEALSHRGVAWFRKGVYDAAIEDATDALALNPYYSVGANQLAWMLATCPDPRFRDGERAVALAEKVVERFPEANFMDTLAAAYAEAGNMEAAVRVQRLAVERLKREVGVKDRASFEQRLKRYGQAVEKHSQQGKASPPTVAAAPGPLIASEPDDPSPSGNPIPDTGATETASGSADRHASLDGFYSVHLSSLRNRTWAEESAATLARGPYPAFVRRTYLGGDPIPWFRVYAGAFDNRKEARECADALKRQGHAWTNVVLLPPRQ